MPILVTFMWDEIGTRAYTDLCFFATSLTSFQVGSLASFGIEGSLIRAILSHSPSALWVCRL